MQRKTVKKPSLVLQKQNWRMQRKTKQAIFGASKTETEDAEMRKTVNKPSLVSK